MNTQQPTTNEAPSAVPIGSGDWLDGFSRGPDTSPPDIETLRKYKLTYHDGAPMKPVHCSISTVWATAIQNDEPVYAIFAAGTNRLVILEKRAAEWREIQLQEVENLYGLLWRMCSAWPSNEKS